MGPDYVGANDIPRLHAGAVRRGGRDRAAGVAVMWRADAPGLIAHPRVPVVAAYPVGLDTLRLLLDQDMFGMTA